MTRHKSKPKKKLSTDKPGPVEPRSQKLPVESHTHVQNSNVNDDTRSQQFYLETHIRKPTELTHDKQSGNNSPLSNDEIHPSMSSSDAKINKPVEIHPFVYWGQSVTNISLRVDLLQSQDLSVNIQEGGRKLVFSAKGKGAHGLQNYHFEIDFHSQVDENFDCQQIERYVLLLIRKVVQPAKWPRLTREQTKLPWLRFDFDRYGGDSETDNEDDSEDIDKLDEEEIRRQQTYELLKQRQREVRRSEEEANQSDKTTFKQCLDSLVQSDPKSTSKMKYDHRKDAIPVTSAKNSAKQLDYKKTYLFLYNLMMFIMFLKVYIVLIIKYSTGSMDDEILQGAAFIIRILTYTQLIETLHPILGLVPGGPFMPFLQVIGRIVVNFFLTETAIRLDAVPYAHYLFIVWSSIEIVRYPFYALRVFKVNVYLLTWCRYTLFIPLYPMGGFFESMVVLSTIKHYEKTGEYSISLPNQANISFNLPIFLRMYVTLLLGPSIYSLMRYMWSQRGRQLKQKED